MLVTMIDIEDLLPEVLTWAPSVPEPLAVRHIRDAARMLCFKGRMWRDTDEIQVSTPLSEGVCTIADAAIVSIESARLGDYPLEAKSVAWLDKKFDNWRRAADDESTARYVTQLNPNTVTVVPKATGLLSLDLLLQPSRSAQQVPEFLKSDYGDVIGKGAAGLILMTPEQTYTNPQLGAAFTAEFNSKLGTASIMATKGQQGARPRVRPNFF